MKIIVLSGLSGSGKSVVLGMLEDLGYYCIDNLPLPLLSSLKPKTLHQHHEEFPLLAVSIDARSRPRDIAEFPKRIAELKEAGLDLTVMFLQADREVILRRYSETRRKHPLTDIDTPLAEAVDRERELLHPIANCADRVIDTSRSNIHQLRELIKNELQGPAGEGLSLLFQSFGYKYGVPEGVDFVFDVRCLPNPHYEEGLRQLSGRDQPVAGFLESQPDTKRMLGDITKFLEEWLPRFQAEDRAYVTVAIGCTGGKHRSVYLVEKLAEYFAKRYSNTLVRHTELP